MLTPETLRRRIRARLAQQRALVLDLVRRRELLQGSLFVRFGVCGKENCICRTGPRHGPYYVLSTGRGGFAYLDPARLARARRLVRSYREYRSGLRRLRRLNTQIVALLRSYQQATARQGGRQLGLSHPTVA